MHRHQKIAQVQKELEYYELGDRISRKEIQDKLVGIEGL